MPAPRLLASYYTLAGDDHPFRPLAAPARPLRARAEAAADAGFQGIGLGLADAANLERPDVAADARRLFDALGIVDVELELLRGWFAEGDEGARATDDRRRLLGVAAALGARHVKIGTSGPDHPLPMIVERFVALCDEAARAGTRIVMEMSPLGIFASLADAAQFVRDADHTHGRLAIDLWHVARSAGGIESVAALSPGILGHVELCDGRRVPEGPYVEDTVERRLPCGEGDFDCGALLGHLAAARYDGVFGVEILSERQRGLDPVEAARIAYRGAAEMLDRFWPVGGGDDAVR